MNLHAALKTGRTAITALLLTSATQQSVQALPDALRFRQPASIANYVQLATAALTLPADIIAIANPDDNRLNFINHGLKLVNEALAVWQQHSPYNAGWACFDAAQGARALAALMTTTPTELINQTDEAEDVDAPIDSNQWQTFVRYANYVLASAEAATRMIATLENNNPAFAALGNSLGNKFVGSMAQRSEFNHSLTSLIRLARYCLQAPNKKLMAIGLVLFIANAITTVWQYQAPERHIDPGHILGGQTDGNTATAAATITQTATTKLAAVQTHRPLGSNPELNIDDFTTCVELYAQEIRPLDRHTDVSYNFGNWLDAWCREHGIAPFFDLNSPGERPLMETLFDFWHQAVTDPNPANRPFFVRQSPHIGEPIPGTGSTRDFCRRFAAFYQQAQQKVVATANTSGAMGSAPSGTLGNTAAAAVPATQAAMASVFMATPGHSLQGATEAAHDSAAQAAVPSTAAAASSTVSAVSPTAAPVRTITQSRIRHTRRTTEENQNFTRDTAARRRKPAASAQVQGTP